MSMRAETYDEIIHKIKTGMDVSSIEIKSETLIAIRRQAMQRFLRQSQKVHRRDRNLAMYWSRYADDHESIVSIAKSIRFSAYMLARMLLEYHFQCSKKRLSEMVKHPREYITDRRLRHEVMECIEVDTDCSPYIDRIKHCVGLEYEYILHQSLRNHQLSFESEDSLRQRGLSKTPDALLTIPFGVYDAQGTFHIVNWIDSKAMFGDQETHEGDNVAQLQGYVHRFGPGMVIYWFGYLNSLLNDADIYICSNFPPSEHIHPLVAV